MTAPFLQIQGIRQEFGDIVAVHDVSLDVGKGEFMTFLGPSGSGKSTTLYILAGFQQPTRGDILLDGRTLLDRPSHQRNIGMVFQRYTLFPNMTAGDNIAFPLKVRRRPKAEIDARVREMLRLVRLEGFEDRRIGKMSGGQQQRVALARALAYDPPVLLMDEPLSALDKKLREEIQHEIRRIHQQTGVTILYVTHDQEEALAVSDRIIVMDRAVIAQDGTPRELYDAPANAFVADFIGEANILPGTVRAVADGVAEVEVGSVLLRLPARGRRPGPARVAVRPGRLGFGEGGIAGTVAKATYVGSDMEYLVETAVGPLFIVSHRTDAPHPVGAAVAVTFAAVGPVLLPE